MLKQRLLFIARPLLTLRENTKAQTPATQVAPNHFRTRQPKASPASAILGLSGFGLGDRLPAWGRVSAWPRPLEIVFRFGL